MEVKSHQHVQAYQLGPLESFNSSDRSMEYEGTPKDRQDMTRMGKQQLFRRNFQFVPIFGFSTILMCTWELVLTGASYVLPNGGPAALVWMFFVAAIGFGFVIISMAEMASMAPTAGGQYHWISEFAPPSYQKVLSYTVGWLTVLGWQSATAGASFAMGSQIQGVLTLDYSSYSPQPWHATGITIIAVTFGALFNTFLAKRLPFIEAIMLFVHIFGFFAIMIPLWVLAPKTPHEEVWTRFQQTSNWPSMGVAALVGLVGPTLTLVGPDSAVHMAEEIKDASRILPRAMMCAWALNGLTGWIMSITFAYCLGPLEDALAPSYNFAYIGTFYTATGSVHGTTVMASVILVMQFCNIVTCMAGASRQMFAFARDSGMPFSRLLENVHPTLKVPVNTIVITWFITCLLSLINLGSNVTFNAIGSLTSTALLSSYIFSIACIAWKRARGEPLLPSRWSLGNWGLPTNLASLVFLTITFLFACFPLSLPVVPMTMNWASVIFGGVSIFAVTFYIAHARRSYVAPVAIIRRDI
ncbi:Choline transport protein [Elsinoe australis]|uniref:Choline transport protein n=1 Tax=Elsinoe australis TaxID=40998 RepID=A0A2P7YR72_9PEZI|nr:Choline transport protein [Elsinoe australis]